MFVDSHCHLDLLEFDKLGLSLEQVIAQATAEKIEHMLCVSVSLNKFEQMAKQVAAYPMVSISCGEHPLHQHDKVDPQQLLTLCQRQDVVAVGETGLDYFYSVETKASQQAAFVSHIEVAKQVNKPLIIHTREARQDTLNLMRSHKAENAGGVLHCFTESWDMAKAAMDMGFYISISGIMTFKNATELRDVVKKIPLDRLLIETDAPYLAPVPFRGKTNQPAYVSAVAKAIAELKGIATEELAAVTTNNFYQLFAAVNKPN
ncbi:TatD family hydrolase [Rheinheimera sp. MMS21-TC3]|uniref:TatD family hydrolase n=1 Tax=Rheinheimera sp. MMS21-TC3 TaxID=3072790 RepID=UPI0028C4F40C|nr:TatD family hydrolase [Rheinheimera sp. MMS21-TC3]WNO61154.1 TatD family hydrolase [Rheinheimera sp. MMS21-TC3]